MQCVQAVIVMKVDGSSAVGFTPSSMACAGYVPNSAEARDMALPGVFSMGVEDGAAVSAAVVSVWIVAYVVRRLVETLKDRDDE